jgi:hypothetical protein
METVKISLHGRREITGDAAMELFNQFLIRNKLAGRFWVHCESGEEWQLDLRPHCISCKIEVTGNDIDDLKTNIGLIHSSVAIDNPDTGALYKMLLDATKPEIETEE